MCSPAHISHSEPEPLERALAPPVRSTSRTISGGVVEVPSRQASAEVRAAHVIGTSGRAGLGGSASEPGGWALERRDDLHVSRDVIFTIVATAAVGVAWLALERIASMHHCLTVSSQFCASP